MPPIGVDELHVARRPVTSAGDAGRLAGSRLVLGRVATWLAALLERDLAVIVGILVLAALTRFPGLEARGGFDGDQGHDMLTLLRLVREGELPLLGPPTSIGEFHHGAAYYYLLAPVAWLSGADPTAVVAWIAAMGVAAVGVTWWFARSVGGRVVGAIAGLLMAVSPAAIEESTFIWNPNPIPLFAALALGGAWRAHATASPRWWVPAVMAAGVVLQLHVLGVVFLPPILALGVRDAVRASRPDGRGGAGAGAILRSIAIGLVLAGLLFVPLLAHELGSGFEETRRALAFLIGDAGSGTLGLADRALLTLFRILGWPLVGLVTDAPAAAIAAVSVTLVLSVWFMVVGRGPAGAAGRWLGLTVLWCSVSLALLAPSLEAVVPGLPNDHYHAFLDPVVIVLLALSVRAVVRGSGQSQRIDVSARAVAGVAIGALLVVDIGLWPPATDPNGGWPASRRAGARIMSVAGGGPLDIRGLPIFKTAEGLGFPVVVAGGDAVIATGRASALRPLVAGAALVLACDRLFEEVLGDSCGGPAEDRFLARLSEGGHPPTLLERFDLSARISVSIYGP